VKPASEILSPRLVHLIINHLSLVYKAYSRLRRADKVESGLPSRAV